VTAASHGAPAFSLVVPAFNESARLTATLERCIAWLESALPSWEIIVVDDGSGDDTRRVATEFSRREPRVRVLAEAHHGKGAAVRKGMLAARGDWRFFADADLSMDLSHLPRFLAAGADVAIASREAPGAERVGEPLSRHLIGRVFNAVVRLLVVPGIRDTQCGYKLFTASAAERLFSVSRLDGFAFDVELLFLARRSGLVVKEVPVTWHHRPGSRVRVATGMAAFGQLLTIRWNSLRGRYDAVRAGARLTT
jgi:glycosyltransferase involved in cell wall biosynthesis